MGQDLIIAASRSLSDSPHSEAVLLTRDRPDAETSTRQYTTLAKDRHPCLLAVGFENPIPESELSAD